MQSPNREYYDEFSATYEVKRFDGYHALIDELETDLTRPHCRDADVLEVGCGTGLILRRLSEESTSAVGLDLSAGMLEVARKRGLTVVQGTATELPFADASFDVVCSFKVLAHVSDIERAVAEAARVTRPGGTLLLEFYNRHSLRHLVKRLTGPRRIGHGPTDEGAILTRFDSLADIRRYLPASVNFRDVRGVRVFTPWAAVHRVPVLRSVFRWLERRGRDGLFRRFGGFLVVILEKSAAP